MPSDVASAALQMAKGMGLEVEANFEQGSFIPADSKGICLMLTLRFVAQAISGLPPLGIDVEKPPLKLDLFAKSGISQAFPHLFDNINWSSPFSDPKHSVYKPLKDQQAVNEEVKRYDLECKISARQDVAKGTNIVDPILKTITDGISQIRRNGSGWVILLLWGGKSSGHALALYLGAKDAMMVDVNCGWLVLRPARTVTLQGFLANYWKIMGYDDFTVFRLMILQKNIV